MIDKLKQIAKNEDELAYIEYFQKLKLAFCEKEEEKVIGAWQEAEFAWMKVKSPLQVGHPLEYYEDNYTHAVALEWDIRIEDESDFDALKFSKISSKALCAYMKISEFKMSNLKMKFCIILIKHSFMFVRQ